VFSTFSSFDIAKPSRLSLVLSALMLIEHAERFSAAFREILILYV
jgi:hypothetical protein